MFLPSLWGCYFLLALIMNDGFLFLWVLVTYNESGRSRWPIKALFRAGRARLGRPYSASEAKGAEARSRRSWLPLQLVF